MSKEKPASKDLYYTKENEWIDFQGTVAYIGTCSPKLVEFKEIHDVQFTGLSGFKKKGELIATILFNENSMEVHMPVDGTLVQVNDELLMGNKSVLLQQPGNQSWMALIIPAQPYERKDLLLPRQYQLIKNKYAK